MINRVIDSDWKELQLKICELQQRMEFMRRQFQYQLAAMQNQVDRIGDMFEDTGTGGDIEQ